MFNKGSSYQSLNCHRSALSLIIGNRVGSDDRIKRLFKGFFKLRPTKAKYNSVWDPSKVLLHLRSWYPLDSLNLENLTKKLAMLIALATGQRVQTLFCISINNIKINNEGAVILITDILKTSGPNRRSLRLMLPFLSNKPEICPVKTLKMYLDKTRIFRQEDKSLTKLFLTFRRPHKHATTQTISRWLKQTMHESGIDTSEFTAHSTRHASSSRAHRQGLTVDSILQAVGWSSRSSTFANHYNRPLQDKNDIQDDFARAVLNN
ncbi:hypothetical protein HF086_003244 [Spodoptera exigua]|uniref:Tyr recombinase domain-containing protein n=1 Tax=Spodoptera exigua TaxID=7107 RepID=A0A922MHQ6_SPOEX|nr:hypothetical protein HF086_003244 [Spodoptera exigua]